MQVLELTQRMVPSSQMPEAATEKQGLCFTKEFLRSVLEEAGGPTQFTELKEEGEARTFISSRALNGHWYHLTHNGRSINFPKPQDALDLIVALQWYVLEQSVPV